MASPSSPPDRKGGRRAAFDLTPNGLKVLQARYLRKDPAGKLLETPQDLLLRVARTVASPESRFPGGSQEKVERWTETFYGLMARREFLPNSPTLMNAGRELGMLSACFVLPVEDSIEGIFDTIKHAAIIQKAGGGTGFDFSRLRPAGDYIRSSGGSSSGPLSFMEVFSHATQVIQQGAFRRGANMGILRIDHPDVLSFVMAKASPGDFTNYNLSLAVTDRFMEDVLGEPDRPHQVVNPRTGERAILSGPDGRPITVGELFERIVDEAWRTGEPGLVFIDRVNESNPTPEAGRIEATNPCGEQPLLPYEACNLGSLNLTSFIGGSPGERRFDGEAFGRAIESSVRFLDNVIEVNRYPLPAIDAISRANRKIGLGVMGLADALFLLGIPYDSQEGVDFGERVMSILEEVSHAASEELARQRGSFPGWKGSRWDREAHRPMRNACATTVAPTGTISIIADCSAGIEPLYALVFRRNILDGQQLLEVNRHFLAAARERGFYSEPLLERIARAGTLAGMEEVPADVRRLFVCARDIAPRWHLAMQAAFQRHCDSSIAKTINVPADASREAVREIYLGAYRERLKGVTVYRDRSRGEQPMALDPIEVEVLRGPICEPGTGPRANCPS
jgi:ribonucleoside-diphosphate reductase alpha chain